MSINIISLFALFSISSLAIAEDTCAVKNFFPATGVSEINEVSYLDANGNVTEKFNCPGSTMVTDMSAEKFHIRRIESEDCGEAGPTLGMIWTAEIFLDAKKPYYLDFKGSRHELDMTCTDSEVVINLPDRTTTWIDPWKAGPQQWRIHYRDSKVFLEYKRLYQHGTLQLKATYK